jgi:hypothetical protein
MRSALLTLRESAASAALAIALTGACTLIADVDYRAPRDDRDLTDVGHDSAGGAPDFVTPTGAAGAGGAAGSRT